MPTIFADVFTTIALGSVLAVFLTFVAIGKWMPTRASDIANKKQHRKWGELAAIEERDIPMMLSALNDYRQRDGKPAISEAAFRRGVGREQLARLDEADRRAHRARERRGF